MKFSARELMDIAYDVARENFGKVSFNFSNLWAKTWAKAKDFRKDSIENWIGAFYTELLVDPRFVYIGAQQWRLREFMDYGEYLREMGKRAQDVQFSEVLAEEGEAKVKGDDKPAPKRRSRKKKEVLETLEGAELTAEDSAIEVDTNATDTEEEEINLDEESVRVETSTDEDEDSYE